jgi:hypothetical protein
MTLYTLTIKVMVDADDKDAAQEQGFALCDMLSPAPIGDVGDPPVVRGITFNGSMIEKET